MVKLSSKVVAVIISIVIIVSCFSENIIAGTITDNYEKDIAYLKLPEGWADAYAYVYNDNPVEGQPVQENAKWPGIKMTKISDGLYRYDMPEGYTKPLIIFNDGTNNPQKKYPADTENKVDASGIVCTGKMICDGVSWKEYIPDDTKSSEESISVNLKSSPSKLVQIVNTDITLSAEISGGSGEMVYTFSDGHKTLYKGSESEYTWVPEKEDNYDISVTVSDGKNKVKSNVLKYIIKDKNDNSKENSLKIVSFALNKDKNLKKGDTAEVSAEAESESEDIKYKFYAMKDGYKISLQSFSENSSCEFNIDESGTYNIYVEIQDNDGNKITCDNPIIIDVKDSEKNNDYKISKIVIVICIVIAAIIFTIILKYKKANNKKNCRNI